MKKREDEQIRDECQRASTGLGKDDGGGVVWRLEGKMTRSG